MPLSNETRARLLRVSTATLCTALFKRGLRNQFIQNVRPVQAHPQQMVGEAFTLRYIPAREDLNPMEEAAGYVRLAKEFAMRQDEIASRVGKSRASVANAMRLLDLHADVQLLVAQGRLTVGHAKAVLSIKDHAGQLLVSDQIIRRQLTVRAALVEGEEWEALFPRFAAVYPGYSAYLVRRGDLTPRMFRLTPVG